MKLHDLIKRNYKKILKPFIKIEVLSNSGWEEIDSLNIAYSHDMYEITTDDTSLICTGDHILIDKDNNEVFSKDSNGKTIISNNKSQQIVKQVKKLNTCYKVYDLSLKGENHVFYVNDLLSHNCLIIDEMSFIQKNLMNDFWSSVIPIVSSSKNSKIIIVSTPNGAEGLYYDIWQQANSKDSKLNEEGWKPFRIHWWETGGIRDEKWKQQQIASIGLERWKQEFECDFLTSSTKRLIPDDILEKYRMQLSELKVKNKDFLNGKKQHIISEDETKLYEFTMWHEFDQTRTYAASGDVSEGGGGDSSVLYIWDITDTSEITMCAMFESDKASISEFAYITFKMLALYNNPFYICERNGIGSGYIDTLRITHQYQNLVQEGKNNEFGVFSHISTKSKACLWARDMMTTQNFGFKIYDKQLINEFSSFVKKETKSSYLSYTALAGAHDDHIMAFIWLCYLIQSDIIEKYFVVCETFRDTLGNTHAKTILPYTAYTSEQIKKVTSDPIYQEFLDFKEVVMNKLGKVLELEQKNNDNFIYQNINRDPYFGENNVYEPSWNNNNSKYSQKFQQAQDLNPNNRMPSFFIN